MGKQPTQKERLAALEDFAEVSVACLKFLRKSITPELVGNLPPDIREILPVGKRRGYGNPTREAIPPEERAALPGVQYKKSKRAKE